MKRNRWFIIIILLIALIVYTKYGDSGNTIETTEAGISTITETGIYSNPAEVAEYIHLFNKLPQNFIAKNKAIELGWNSTEGNLWEVTNKMSIGGDAFGNREELLPKADNRIWFECDVNYNGGYRGAERIVYSNDGLIYYTDNHYESFKKLY